jgi:subtilisin family serine protease
VGALVPNVGADIIGDPLVTEQWALGNTGSATIAGTLDGDVKRSTDGTISRLLGTGSVVVPAPGYDLHASALRTATDGAGVIVAVIDTGIDVTHPELVGHLWTDPDSGIHGWNVVSNSSDVTDASGHGTAVAGIIAAARDGRGIEGVAPGARIMAVKVGDREQGINLDDVARAIAWAVQHGASVINLSLSSDSAPQSLLEAIDYARRNGVIIVAAAGNAGTNTSDLPGGLPGVIRVGAVGPDGRVPDFSNLHPDVVAPGVLVLTTRAAHTLCADVIPGLTTECDLPDMTIVARTGTSFSAAHVSGVAALLRALHPDLTSEDVESALRATARDIGDPGEDLASGMGMVDADAAAMLVATRPAPAAPLTSPILRGSFVTQLLASRRITTDGVSIAGNLVFDAFNTPYAKSIATAKAHGLIRGRWFDPLRPVTRAEALGLVSRSVTFPDKTTAVLVPTDIILSEQRDLVARSMAAGVGAPWSNQELNAPLTSHESDALLRDLAAAELAGRVSVAAP